MATPVRLTPQGPFSLTAALAFQRGFAPADYANNGGAAASCTTGVAHASADDPAGTLRFAFARDEDGRPAGALVRAAAPNAAADDGSVLVEPYGGISPHRAATQIARILSLDVDGRAFPEVGERDPAVGRLQRAYPGLRPVCFNSPYEAAAWAVIGHRIRITQAAALRTRIARAHGTLVDVGGLAVPAFPSPQTLLGLTRITGLSDVKTERLHAVARAALEGELDAPLLRGLEPADALRRLCRILGIGPFSAELVLVRGAGAPDHFAAQERRLHASMAETYGVRETDTTALARIAGRWSPYRSWVALLFRSHREHSTGEIARGRRSTHQLTHQSTHQASGKTAVGRSGATQLRIGGEN